MRTRLIALVALVLGLASCQNDAEVGQHGSGNEISYTLTISAPELATTRADGDTQPGRDSAYGAIDYTTDWSQSDVRYILEVYDVDKDGYDGAEPIKTRMVNIHDSYQPTTFDLRLIPNRNYRFVVFADFVDEGSTVADDQATIGKHHEIGSTLANINIKKDGINDECTDAYYVAQDLYISDSSAQSLVLTRPYAKVRVVATDLAELNLNVHPKAVRVTYDAIYPKSFNAITGEISTSTEGVTEVFESQYVDKLKNNMDAHYYNAGYDAMTDVSGAHTHLTLMTDYILAKGGEQTPIHFEIAVYDDEAMTSLIKRTVFDTEIPIERNHLTTIIGNVLTTSSSIKIIIDDNFEAPEHIVEVWDGVSVTTPEVENGSYVITNGAELAWLAAEVNGGNNFRNQTVKLADNIDLGGEAWTPIGKSLDTLFSGHFDGQGYTVANFMVEADAGAGLFGYVGYGSIRNVTVKGAAIEAHHYAGALAGYVQNPGTSIAEERITIIDNCHAEDVQVTLTPDANNDNGDKAGGLLGYTVRTAVSNCSVEDARVTAYRDCAALIGHANVESTVVDCSASDSTVVADQSVEYKEAGKAANADSIVGRKVEGLDLSTDTATNVEVAVIIGNADLTQPVNITTEATHVLRNMTVRTDEGAAVVVAEGIDARIVIDGNVNILGKTDGIQVPKTSTVHISGDNGSNLYVGGGHESNDNPGSGIGYAAGNAGDITIDRIGCLNANGYGLHAFGVGSVTSRVVITNTFVESAGGGYVQPTFVNDLSYGKTEPEGGAAIGGREVTISNSSLGNVRGGSKAAAIGNSYWQSTKIVIENSNLDNIQGGNASAAIGGSRYSQDAKHDVEVTIMNSFVTAYGGQYAAAIGSGYDTHCNGQNFAAKNHIVIIDSDITAVGGQYGAGIGTGYHSAYLSGSIDTASNINATPGESREKYTIAQGIGYGVVDPAREYSGDNTVITFEVAGTVIAAPTVQ